ncbi:MAG: glycosyltransferase family 4 protein [Cyanobacteria bacterium P01_F01_bin.4]
MTSNLLTPHVNSFGGTLQSSTAALGKVSIIASDLSNSGAGRWKGAVRPFLLANALQTLGYRVEILGFADQLIESEFTAEIPIKALPTQQYPQFFQSARQLMTLATGDIIYAYKLKPSSFGAALWQRLSTKRPVILDIDDWELSWHGGDQYRYQGALKQRARDLIKPDGALRNPDHPLYLRWLEKCVRYADAVTLHTQFLRSRFGGFYIPNGKDIHLFDPSRYDANASRARYGLSDYRVLMFPGAPRPYKGLEDILTALDQLNQPDLRVVIVGGSPYDNYDQELIKKWGRWIIKIPKAPYEQMPEIVAAAHIVVVPQRDSPAAQAQFPLKLTDAMAMSKPILATRVGDIPDILQDTGYLVDPKSPEQMADRVTHIFANLAEAEAKARKARIRCVEHYSIAAMAQHLLPVMQSVGTTAQI